MNLDQAIANTRAHLLSLRNAAGHWEGELSSSALSTATAVVALSTVDAEGHEAMIGRGARWLVAHQNADGGWGDTTISKSNLSTTLLCWSALRKWKARPEPCHEDERLGTSLLLSETWIRERVGSLEPGDIAKAVVARYGKDKTFSVPILMLCAICGTLGENGWRRVLPLPFELAALPRPWFGAVGLPVVSYALPALIAIGHARFFHAPPAWWNPLRWLRAFLWERISPMLKTLQPSTGGYLEATPLTSFVTMALASAEEKQHPCVPVAVEFLRRSQREDGSWAIDTNLATWGTTLAVKALACSPGFSPSVESGLKPGLRTWLLAQQYREVHPFTNAAPGGWAWTDLPGGVPDADDTSGALIALWHLCDTEDEKKNMLPAVEAGIAWLLGLQNRDGGMPTFCRGWGTLPFDRSTPEITAHALWAWRLWERFLSSPLQSRLDAACPKALAFLMCGPAHHERWRLPGVAGWEPLWFGNEHVQEERNVVYGTAQVMHAVHAAGCAGVPFWSAEKGRFDREAGLRGIGAAIHSRGAHVLLHTQLDDGGWGGDAGGVASIEETAVALQALCGRLELLEQAGADPNDTLTTQTRLVRAAIERGVSWLMQATKNGTTFPAAPIGLYFARLWYHERLYPVVWTLGALEAVRRMRDSA